MNYSILLILAVLLCAAQNAHGKCVCVPYYQCTDKGVIDYYGSGVLNNKFGKENESNPILASPDPLCTGIEICCELQEGMDTTPTPVYMEKPVTHVIPEEKPHDEEDDGGFVPGEPLVPDHVNGCGVKRINPLDPRIDTTRIAQYTNVKPGNAFYGEYPWMIAVFKELDGKLIFTCGGSLIKENVVLTAAHCVSNIGDYRIVVRGGEWDSRTKNEPIPHQDRLVHRMSIHDDFNSGSLLNDIALLFVEEPFVLGKTVDTICIPKEHSFEPEYCQATGWGINSFNERGISQPVMKKVYLSPVESLSCQESLRTTRLGRYFRLHKSFICASGKNNQDTCTGDGGGPLVCANYEGNQQKYAQIGIVSWGIECGTETPGVYASVTYFYDWITQQLEDH